MDNPWAFSTPRDNGLGGFSRAVSKLNSPGDEPLACLTLWASPTPPAQPGLSPGRGLYGTIATVTTATYLRVAEQAGPPPRCVSAVIM